MDPWIALIAAAAGYLIGSISFARVVGRIVAPGHDLTRTQVGSAEGAEPAEMGFVSATTVSMHLGSRFGFVTVVLDMLKVALPAVALKLLYPGEYYQLIAATAGMLGHVWPVYHRFRGGRGLSAVYGGMFAIDWIGVFATWLIGVVLGLAVRSIFVFYFAGLWLFIPWLWLRTHDLAYVAYAIVANILFIIAMLPEAKAIIKMRREGVRSTFKEDMQMTGMGRGFYKMGVKIGLVREEGKEEGKRKKEESGLKVED